MTVVIRSARRASTVAGVADEREHDTTEFLRVDGGAPAGGETTVFPLVDETTVFRPAVMPPEVPHAPLYWAPPAPRRRRWPFVLLAAATVAGAIAAAIIVGLASTREPLDRTGGIATDTPNAKYPPQRDVTVDACTIERTGAVVGGSVTNRTDRRAGYAIDAVMVDQAGTVVTSGTAVVQGVDPGTQVAWQATLPPVPASGTSATCRVVKVNRIPG